MSFTTTLSIQNAVAEIPITNVSFSSTGMHVPYFVFNLNNNLDLYPKIVSVIYTVNSDKIIFKQFVYISLINFE
ncbi:hypothetical protein GCM10011501_02840 [Thalassotalea profundi]|uniref:Uncharacterized protein n=1 Tax=Thalassotalea profundi TaxID=2036687 RepID=A0ABQ3ICP3_9GAMM|nr:hypothetical protein GCM10011501_02840 [Thalassotalea profundi]